MRTLYRFGVGVALTAAISIPVAAAASPSFASTHVKPTITSTEASFVVPASPAGTWILTLWTYPTVRGSLLGTTQGTSGTLSVPVPHTSTCDFQADVRFTPAGGTTSSFYSGAIVALSQCGTPCPTNTNVNFRWHYSANGSSGSWSGTKTVVCAGSLSMGPQAMEGDLKISPGTILKTGYDFTVPGNNATLSIFVGQPQVTFTVRCVSGAAPSQSTLTVIMPDHSYTVTDSQWYPSGDQQSPLVYQGSIKVPDLCAGGQVRLDQGGTFTANVS